MGHVRAAGERGADTMSAPIDRLMGDPADGCRRFTDDIAMHWYPQGAKPGDACFCGEMTMREDG